MIRGMGASQMGRGEHPEQAVLNVRHVRAGVSAGLSSNVSIYDKSRARHLTWLGMTCLGV
jgi:hypothetical protein